MTSKPFITCLWFDNQGEDAAHYSMAKVFAKSFFIAKTSCTYTMNILRQE
jgi:predicted 3-demethylubiquinone-9 3-methyltransferase (glyoxalase superfamily)